MDFKTKYLKYKNKYLELKNGMNKIGGYRLNFRNKKDEIKSADFSNKMWTIKKAGTDESIPFDKLDELNFEDNYNIIYNNKNDSVRNCMNCKLITNKDWERIEKERLIKENSITYSIPKLDGNKHLDLRNTNYIIKNHQTKELIEKEKNNFIDGLIFDINYIDSKEKHHDVLNCKVISRNWVE